MIGLKRHSVEIVDYDPSWAILGEGVCRAVRSACGELLVDVQHVGSTAVPGLAAKPILDIAAAVSSVLALPELVSPLAEAGYAHRGDRGDSGGHLFVTDSAPDVRFAHLHVVELNSRQWHDFLAFRDLLRSRPAIRDRYAQLKKDLAAIYANDRESYTQAKADFIRETLRR